MRDNASARRMLLFVGNNSGIFLIAVMWLIAGQLQPANVFAQAVQPAHEQKLDRLVDLLQDPDIRAALTARNYTSPTNALDAQERTGIEKWEVATRAKLRDLVAAIPQLPAELQRVYAAVHSELVSTGYGWAFLLFCASPAIFINWGRFFERGRHPKPGTVVTSPLPLFCSLILVSVFFAIDWPPLARKVLLAYLLAIVGFKLGSLTARFSLPANLQPRAKLIVGLTVFAVATATLVRSLGTQTAISDAFSYLLSTLVLASALEMCWARQRGSRLARIALPAAITVIWLLWCLQLRGLFWLGLYALILPAILRTVTGMASSFFSTAPFSLRNVLIECGARGVVIVLASLWLATVWRMTPEGLGHSDPFVTAIFFGLLKSVGVLLAADLCWRLAKTWIDGNLANKSDERNPTPAEIAQRARFRTLLPILRNALAVFIVVMAGLIVLAQLGVEIAPLIAGAGVFGVALGFGSQTLVKDVISGVFYMLDDAFRVGEYIQAKNYKGTVEGFSLRSVRLRHHRGPVFTVPFGELGAVQNMSRDWGVVKFRISVSHAANVETTRKLTKKIGAAMLEDPELGPLFIEPLKMKGIEEFADYGMVLSFGMTLKPSPMQSFVRRRANLLLREAFLANGIEFAMPSVQVDGEDKGAAAAAAAVEKTRTKQISNASAVA